MIISQLRRIAACTTLILAATFSSANAGYLYVLNGQGSSAAGIYGFQADPETGALTPLAGFPVTAGNPGSPFFLNEAMAVDAERRRLFVLNDGPNTLSVYAIDAATGALSEMPYSPLQLAAANWGTVNVPPSGSPVVVGGMLSGFSGLVSSFVFEGDTAQAAAGSPFSTGMATPYSGAFSSDGAYFYTGGFTVFSPYIAGFSVDAATGVLSALPGSPFDAGGPRPAGFSTDAAGRIFVVDNNNSIRAFTTSAGIPAAVSGNPFSANAGAVDTFAHPAGEFIFVAGRLGNQVSAFRIVGDGSSTLPTGTSTVGSGGAFANILAMGRDGRFLYVANAQSRSVSTIGFDAGTGGLSFMNVMPDNTLGSAGMLVGMALFEEQIVVNPPPAADEMIRALIVTLESYNLPRGTLRSFAAKLENALKDMEAGNVDDARDKLNAFVNHVRAQKGKALTAARADELTAAAQAIIDVLEAEMIIPLIDVKKVVSK